MPTRSAPSFPAGLPGVPIASEPVSGLAPATHSSFLHRPSLTGTPVAATSETPRQASKSAAKWLASRKMTQCVKVARCVAQKATDGPMWPAPSHFRIWPLSPCGTGKLTRHRTVFPHLELREQTPTCRRHRMQVAKISIRPLATQSARRVRGPTAEDFHPLSTRERPWKAQHVPRSPSLPYARHESTHRRAGSHSERSGVARPCGRVLALGGPDRHRSSRHAATAHRRTTEHHSAPLRNTNKKTRAYSPIATFAPRLHEGGAALSPPSPNRTSLTPNSAGRRASVMSVPAGRI